MFSLGYTPLHYAVRQSSEELVRILLENGADPNAWTPSGHTTPLHRAAGRGRAELVKLLLGEISNGVREGEHDCID